MYEGYLVKILGIDGEQPYVFPLKYIAYKGFKCTIHGQDVDSFTNTDGITNRNALANVKPKCQIQTIDGITQTEFCAIMDHIRSRYVNVKEKKVIASIFAPEINGYITHEWYVPDIEPPMTDITEDEITYDSITISFVSNGGKI